MTVTIALTAAEAEAIARANAALSWIRAVTFPWAFADSRAVKACASSLRECLEDYAGLENGTVHPAAVFLELGRGQDNALGIALDLVTQDIRDWTAELVRLANAAEDAARMREEGRAA
jgi:hypothetical protein